MGDAGELYTMKGSGGPNIRKGWGHTGHPSATSLKLTSSYDRFQFLTFKPKSCTLKWTPDLGQ